MILKSLFFVLVFTIICFIVMLSCFSHGDAGSPLSNGSVGFVSKDGYNTQRLPPLSTFGEFHPQGATATADVGSRHSLPVFKIDRQPKGLELEMITALQDANSGDLTAMEYILDLIEVCDRFASVNIELQSACPKIVGNKAQLEAVLSSMVQVGSEDDRWQYLLWQLKGEIAKIQQTPTDIQLRNALYADEKNLAELVKGSDLRSIQLRSLSAQIDAYDYSDASKEPAN